MRDCFRSLVALLGGALFATTAAPPSARADNDIDIITLSSRPDTVSGGDVLVRVDFPRGVSSISMLLNGLPVTGAFRQVGSGSIMGLVTGLKLGENTLTAQGSAGRGDGNGRGQTRSITLINHPITGPIISGPQ